MTFTSKYAIDQQVFYNGLARHFNPCTIISVTFCWRGHVTYGLNLNADPARQRRNIPEGDLDQVDQNGHRILSNA